MSQAIVPFRPREELDVETLGRVFAQSGFFQDAREAAQAITKIIAGRELGLPAVAAMTGIYIVKGRVTLSANLIAGLIKRSGKYDYRVTRLDNDGCAIAFTERGQPLGESTFTKEDRDRAGLAGDQWKHYPRNMYFARALSNGARWFTPELFGGPVYVPEEMGAAVDDEGTPLIDLRTGEVVEGEVAKPKANGGAPLSLEEMIAKAGRAKTMRALAARYAELFAEAESLGLAPREADPSWTAEQLFAACGNLKLAVETKRTEPADLSSHDEAAPEPAAETEPEAAKDADDAEEIIPPF